MGRASSSTHGGFGLPGQLREVQPRAITRVRVSRVFSEYQDNDDQCTSGQAGRDTSLSKAAKTKEHSVEKVSGNFYWDSHVHEASDSTSSTILSGTSSSQEIPGLGDPKPRQSRSAGPCPVGGVNMVDRTSSVVEWLLFETAQIGLNDPDGCVQDKLWCSVAREIHWRPVVISRDPISHKLPRAASSPPGSPDVCQRSKGDNSLGSNGQCSNHDIHQSEGRKPFTIPDTASKDY